MTAQIRHEWGVRNLLKSFLMATISMILAICFYVPRASAQEIGNDARDVNSELGSIQEAGFLHNEVVSISFHEHESSASESRISTDDSKQKSLPERISSRARVPYARTYIDFGGDVLSPRKSGEYLTTAGSGSFGQGFRPVRYLQAGYAVSFLGNFNGTPTSTAPIKCTSGCTGTYTATIGARGTMLSIDVRPVLPLFREQLQISAGGGFTWINAIQHADTGGISVPNSCPPLCAGNTSGHGPSEIVEAKYFPGNGHVGIGFHVRNIQVTSSGLNFATANSEGIYRDHFLAIGGEITVQLMMSH
jgi:hypothetical protein